MTEKAFKQMMSGLKEAKNEYAHIVFPDCSAKYYAVRDAIELLKKQEPKSVESIQMDRSDTWGADLSGYCPSCKRPLKNRFNKQFCGECGQAVKWE